jgi:hypothetical protein
MLKNPGSERSLEPDADDSRLDLELFDVTVDESPSRIVLCGAWNRVHRVQREPEGQAPKVLRDRGQQELIASAGSTSQSQSVDPQDPLHVREQHLNLLPILA